MSKIESCNFLKFVNLQAKTLKHICGGVIFFSDRSRVDCNYFLTNADILQGFSLNTSKVLGYIMVLSQCYSLRNLESIKDLNLETAEVLKHYHFVFILTFFSTKNEKGMNFRFQIKTTKNFRSQIFVNQH